MLLLNIDVTLIVRGMLMFEGKPFRPCMLPCIQWTAVSSALNHSFQERNQRVEVNTTSVECKCSPVFKMN